MTKKQLIEGQRLSHEIEFLDSIIKRLQEQEFKVVLHHKSGESIVVHEDKISLDFNSSDGNFGWYNQRFILDILCKSEDLKDRLSRQLETL